jgi:hypothetical protein
MPSSGGAFKADGAPFLEEYEQCKVESAEYKVIPQWYRKRGANYLEEAQKAEERVERLYVQDKKAKRLHASLKFDALCHALDRNDPPQRSYRVNYTFRRDMLNGSV